MMDAAEWMKQKLAEGREFFRHWVGILAVEFGSYKRKDPPDPVRDPRAAGPSPFQKIKKARIGAHQRSPRASQRWATRIHMQQQSRRINRGLAALALMLISTAFASAANVQTRSTGVVTDTPAITITTATADTKATPTTTAHEAELYWKFGTVAGSFGTCTVQLKTTYDGTNYLTLGSAVSVTATTGTANAWSVIAEVGTTSVVTGAVSSSAALGFGLLTKETFACSSYGTSAPVTVSVIYR